MEFYSRVMGLVCDSNIRQPFPVIRRRGVVSVPKSKFVLQINRSYLFLTFLNRQKLNWHEKGFIPRLRLNSFVAPSLNNGIEYKENKSSA